MSQPDSIKIMITVPQVQKKKEAKQNKNKKKLFPLMSIDVKFLFNRKLTLPLHTEGPNYLEN